jgi:adenosylcobinamide-GDP ribazoletransferase
LRVAVSFLTILPAGPRDLSVGGPLGQARAWFPLVGLLLGGALALLDVLLSAAFPRGLADALLLAALVVMTRAVHLEGFMDSCDALFGGFTRERRLDIMRDPHVGAFAVVGGALLLLLKWTALGALSPAVRTPALVLFPCLGRWGTALVMALFPYARSHGMGTAFQEGYGRRHLMVALLTALAASVLTAGLGGIVLLATASAVAWGLGRWTAGLLGGLTGDTYGAINEAVELTTLLVAVAAPGLIVPIWALTAGS